MELYILDSLLRRTEVIDVFESLIWTERLAAWGDFELSIYSTTRTRTLLVTGTRLALNKSYRVMEIENVENKIDSEGRRILKVKGRSLEYILDSRVARNNNKSLNEVPSWNLTGKPAAIARTIFNAICRNNTLNPQDNIPFLKTGTFLPASTIPEPAEDITVELKVGSLYAALQDICQAYDLGFRLVRNFDKSELYFDIYAGSDRTTAQGTLPPVVFSPSLDNLTDVTELNSTSSFKNVAYCFHPVIGTQVVVSENGNPNPTGLERRVIYVDASSVQVPERTYTLSQAQLDAIQAATAIASLEEIQKTALGALRDKKRLTPPQVTAITAVTNLSALTSTQKTNITAAKNASVAYNATEDAHMIPLIQQRGKEELAKTRTLAALDGELPPTSPYKYDVAYRLGDLLEMRNTDGIANFMRVTEQIFVSDIQGEREYPTLTVDKYIIPGVWNSWESNEEWVDALGSWVDR